MTQLTKLVAVIWLLLSALPPMAFGQTPGRFNAELTREILKSVEFQYSIANFRGSGWLDDAIDQVNRQRADIVRCVNAREKDLEDVTQTLGAEFMEQLTSKEGKSPEESAVAMQISELRGIIAECKILLEKSNRLLTRLSELEGRIKREQLNQRDTSFVHNLTHGLSDLVAYNRARLNVLVSILSGNSSEHASALLVILLAGVLFGLFLSRRARTPLLTPKQPLSSQIAADFGFLVQKRAPFIVPAGLLLGYLWATQKSGFMQSTYAWLLSLLLGYMLSLILARSLVRRIKLHAHNEYGIEFPGRGLYLRLVVIITLLAIWLQELVILGLDTEHEIAQGLLRNLLASAIILALLEFAFFFNRLPTLPRAVNLIRIAGIILLIVSLFLELIGYRSLSRYIWGGLVLTAVAITGYYLLERILRDFCDGLDNGSRPWQVRFRSFLSVDEGEPVPGLLWFRLASVAL